MTTKNIALFILFVPSLLLCLYYFPTKTTITHKSSDGTILSYNQDYELFSSQKDNKIVYLNGTIYKYINAKNIQRCQFKSPDQCSKSNNTPQNILNYFKTLKQ